MRDFGTGPEIVIVVVGVVPIHVDLAIVRIEVDVRNIAIAIARTRFLSNFFHFTDNFIQNYLSSPRVAGKFSESKFVKIR